MLVFLYRSLGRFWLLALTILTIFSCFLFFNNVLKPEVNLQSEVHMWTNRYYMFQCDGELVDVAEGGMYGTCGSVKLVCWDHIRGVIREQSFDCRNIRETIKIAGNKVRRLNLVFQCN